MHCITHALFRGRRACLEIIVTSGATLCRIWWSKVGLAIVLSDITQHVNRASVGTTYAWNTGVIKKESFTRKKKNDLSDNEMV